MHKLAVNDNVVIINRSDNSYHGLSGMITHRINSSRYLVKIMFPDMDGLDMLVGSVVMMYRKHLVHKGRGVDL